MQFKELNIEGVFEINLLPLLDNRGFFMRTYDNEKFIANGLVNDWVQENHSKTKKINTIRGLHMQLGNSSETKLVRCISGKILDVFVDLRYESKTFGRWGSVELSKESNNLIYLPKGIAHGFCTLSENSEVLYKVDNFYDKKNEIGIIWNDTDLNINWPTKTPILSEKDNLNITLKQYINKYIK